MKIKKNKDVLLLLLLLFVFTIGIKKNEIFKTGKIKAETPLLKLIALTNKTVLEKPYDFKVIVNTEESFDKFDLEIPQNLTIKKEEVLEKNKEIMDKFEENNTVKTIHLRDNVTFPVEVVFQVTATSIGEYLLRVKDGEKNNDELKFEVLEKEEILNVQKNKVILDAKGKDYPTIEDLPFEALNDKDELDGYTRMGENIPIEFSTTLKDGRQYYMNFGPISNQRENSDIRPGGSVGAPKDTLYIDLPKEGEKTNSIKNISGTSNFYSKGIPLLGSQVAVSTNEQLSKWVTYSYSNGMGMGGPDSTYSLATDRASNQTGNYYPTIVKMYTNGTNVISYGVSFNARQLTDSTKILGYYKVKIEPVGKTGRIKTTITYLNAENISRNTAMAYGLHVDIQGKHVSSKLFSLGDNKGMYFKEDHISDGNPYLLKFYLGDEETSPIAQFANNNFSANAWGKVGNNFTNVTTPSEIGKDVQYKLSHPSVGFRWSNKVVEPLEKVDFSLAQSVTSKIDVTSELNKQALNLKTGDIANTSIDDELEYSITLLHDQIIHNGVLEDTLPKEVSAPYDISLYSYPDGTVNSKIKIPLDIKEVYDKENHKISVKQETFSPKKSVLTYKIKVLSSATGKTITNSVTINGLDNEEETIDEEKASYDVIIKKTPILTVSYLNEDRESIIPDKIVKGKIGDSYQETPLELEGYQYDYVVGKPAGQFTDTHETVQFIYKENRFNLKQTVSRMDGSSADEVSLGENLKYGVEVKSALKEANPNIYYKEFTLTEPIDSSLEAPTNIQLVTSDGDNVGSVSYDKDTHKIVGNISESNKLNQTNSFYLIYQAKVKNNISNETVIKAKAKAEGSYTNGMMAKEKESNEVLSKVIAGELLFEMAPKNLNFGDPVKISQKEKKYPLNKQDGDLSVKDLRGIGKNWSMTAKMKTPLTHSSGSELTNSMYYSLNGKEQIIGQNQSALIHAEKTVSSDSVIISNNWTNLINQPFIKIKGGKAKRGEYTGLIQWSLQNVPENIGFAE